jgi:pyruvate dehydrogenase E2 component (dihydrolipoamide acetyltransferase)
VPAAPSTRRLARELGVDLKQVKPSGPGGKVTSEDVQAFAEARKHKEEAPEKPTPPKGEKAAPTEEPPAPTFEFDKLGPVERIPLRSVRKATAKHMALAWQQIPHVSHQDVADVTELDAFRRKHKDRVAEMGGALSLTVFALKAAVAALKAFPRINASIDTESSEIILKRYYHIGVAVDSERGLIVPVIRDVDRKSITDLAIELKEIATRTREGKISQEELSGGTFTITNVGILGGTGFAPIVNYPQAAILGMGQARLQPVIRGDLGNYKIVPRLMLPLIIGFDHRILDGADAARFINFIIETLENPEKMLMVV